MKYIFHFSLFVFVFVFVSMVTSCSSKEETDFYPSAEIDVKLSATPTSLSATAIEETKTISVTSNVQWTVSVDNTWCTLSATSGQGNGTITITMPNNTTKEPRTANIVLSAQGKTVTVSLTQQGGILPVMSTIDASASRNTATVSGTFTSQFDVTECGVVYALTDNPTLENATKVVSADRTNINVTLTGLDSGKKYYVRGYATSIIGTSYSDVKTITTSGDTPNENDNPTPSLSK